MSAQRPAVFLDRDGVLNTLVWDARSGTHESPLFPEDVALADGAASAVRELRAAGLPVFIVSNQPSAAKGIVSVVELRAVHARVLELLTDQGADVDGSYLCLHHPDGDDHELGGQCDCRKPAPGLLLQAAAEHRIDLPRSWLIGDTDADVGAAEAAGLAGAIVVSNPLSAHRRGAVAAASAASVDTVRAAADRVLVAMTPLLRTVSAAEEGPKLG